MKEEQFFWQRDYRKPKDLTTWEALGILLMREISPYLTRLTRYVPFSLFCRSYGFHYRFKEVNEAVYRIQDIAAVKGFWFTLFLYQRDERFLIIFGQFEAKRKNVGDLAELFSHFQKLFEHENSYVTPLEEERTAKFVFVRNIDSQ